MIFFRYILAAYRFQRNLKLIEGNLAWTKDDEASYASFATSPSGRKLIARMQNNVLKHATDAVRKQSLWANGHACGIQDHALFLDGHLPPVQSASEQSEEDELQTTLSESPELVV